MTSDILAIYERMASSGTAPDEHCSEFGTGYEDAFNRLEDVFLRRRFERGDSSEKFVVGPYGSGKTHFMRQMMEIARGLDCVTAEVKLDKTIDFTDPLAVYKEVVAELRPPEGGRGLLGLLKLITARIARSTDDEETARHLVRAWASTLEHGDVQLASVGYVAGEAFRAIVEDDEPRFRSCTRWLAGDVGDKRLAGDLGVSVLKASEQKNHGRKALLSLFQIIRQAGYRGTVVCFDEADQSLSTNREKTQRILSMFQSDINSIADLRGGSALIVYGLTPDIFEKMYQFPALQDRVADPEPPRGFIEGDSFAPRIDVTNRGDALADLIAIAESLVRLFVSGVAPDANGGDLLHRARSIATEVHESDARAGNRRAVVKRVCSMLLESSGRPVPEDEGVEAEV